MPASEAARTVLVIDDEGPIRDVIRFFLERAGYHVVDADNGRTGMALFREHKPALVITDIQMPEGNGLDMIAEFRQLNPAIKIIAISGADSAQLQEIVASAQGFGSVEIVAKPFRPRSLLEIVERLLQVG
jgi:DNA-binding NtrC family response regulator